MGARRAPKAQSSSTAAGPSTRDKAKGKATRNPFKQKISRWGGHYFEVQKCIEVEKDPAKPVTIQPPKKRHGRTWAKLSSVRDGRLFSDMNTLVDESPDDPPNPLDEDEPEDGSWRWEAEDDFTVGHVWPRGPSDDKGFIYVCSFVTRPQTLSSYVYSISIIVPQSVCTSP